jgi:exodeoxyribonuclease V
MTIQDFLVAFRGHFPHSPTKGQAELVNMLAEFIGSSPHEKQVFVLKGYAGTGKTTIVSALVKTLPLLQIESVLLAPTGRAAKVLSSYSNTPAYTIHKKIYMPHTASNGSFTVRLLPNKHKNTLFIIDEASMIPGQSAPGDVSLFGMRNLLDDLVEYVFEGVNCRLLLIGDAAQLPPVGSILSPALDIKWLSLTYHMNIRNFELTEVVRQALESGILANATAIREKITLKDPALPFFHIINMPDVKRVEGYDLEDSLNINYSRYGTENVVVITRSNKRANIYNREIRNRILFREDELAAGDQLMVVRNNYFWLSPESKAGFVANGDIVEIKRIKKTESFYGFRFADVTLRMIDYPDEPEVDARLLLYTLTSETPALPMEENRRLFDEVMLDYADVPQRQKRMELLKSNPYFNALQVKYAYALTCHKTQGGQWDAVFIDHGYLADEQVDVEMTRWLYTAVTRASQVVYFVNFQDRFFEE